MIRFTVYTSKENVSSVKEKLKELGCDIEHELWLVSNEYAIFTEIPNIDTAKEICKKIEVDESKMRISITLEAM